MRTRHPHHQVVLPEIVLNTGLGKKRRRKDAIPTGSKHPQIERVNEPRQNPKRGATAHEDIDGEVKCPE